MPYWVCTVGYFPTTVGYTKLNLQGNLYWGLSMDIILGRFSMKYSTNMDWNSSVCFMMHIICKGMGNHNFKLELVTKRDQYPRIPHSPLRRVMRHVILCTLRINVKILITELWNLILHIALIVGNTCMKFQLIIFDGFWDITLIVLARRT